jgi:hypothetical protein
VTTVLCAVSIASGAQAQFAGNGADLSSVLPVGFEASGVDHHAGRDELIVVGDGGDVLVLAPDGGLRASYALAGDLEGVCVAGPNSDFVYLLREKPEAILEFDLLTGLVGRVFDLGPALGTPSSRGPEGIEFVPDDAHPEGGTFLVASTFDGRIHRLALSIASSTTANQVVALGSFQPTASNDLRGLDYDAAAGVLYSLYSEPTPLVRVSTAAGALIANWPLPQPQIAVGAAEGLCLRGCDVFVCEDGGSGASGLTRFDGIDTYSACRTFAADVAAVSVLFGGTQTLTLDLGPAAAGLPYVVLGSAALGNPGLGTPGIGGLVLPLVVDSYFLTSLGGLGAPYFGGFAGVLDAAGSATAQIVVPPFSPVVSGLVGERLFHAALVIDPTLGWFVHASNATGLRFTF